LPELKRAPGGYAVEKPIITYQVSTPYGDELVDECKMGIGGWNSMPEGQILC
jgi:hypothetical protein